MPIKKIGGIVLCACLCINAGGCGKSISQSKSIDQVVIKAQERTIYRAPLFTDTLCVSPSKDTSNETILEEPFHSAGLFDLRSYKVRYGKNLMGKIAPASTTKIMTALIAMESADLSKMVTVGSEIAKLPSDSSVAGLRVGDRLTMEDLLYALMLPSGNDAAVAIAEAISGSTDQFAKRMTKRAHELGATHTNFVNPHGLDDPNHYTTAYDLYLIFNACLSHDIFQTIIHTPSHTVKVAGGSGALRELTFHQTNYYAVKRAVPPKTVHVIGGKTGTTDAAGSCLILYSETDTHIPFVSVVMGAKNKPLLYKNMNRLLEQMTSNTP